MDIHSPEITDFLKNALAEDIGQGDITSTLTIPEDATAQFTIGAREPLIACGIGLAIQVFEMVDSGLKLTAKAKDGDRLNAGDILIEGSGSARAVLAAERTALNLLMHLSGVATLTAKYVDAIQGSSAKVLDTRKTLPGMRALQKYAVKMGGGQNHRMRLDDAILIKDNHIELSGGDITKAITLAKSGAPAGMIVEVECDTLEQAKAAIAANADILLLDNMSNEQLASAVAMNADKAKLEASGNVNLETIRGIAKTGVDYISIGRLTHSAPSVDIGLDM